VLDRSSLRQADHPSSEGTFAFPYQSSDTLVERPRLMAGVSASAPHRARRPGPTPPRTAGAGAGRGERVPPPARKPSSSRIRPGSTARARMPARSTSGHAGGRRARAARRAARSVPGTLPLPWPSRPFLDRIASHHDDHGAARARSDRPRHPLSRQSLQLNDNDKTSSHEVQPPY